MEKNAAALEELDVDEMRQRGQFTWVSFSGLCVEAAHVIIISGSRDLDDCTFRACVSWHLRHMTTPISGATFKRSRDHVTNRLAGACIWNHILLVTHEELPDSFPFPVQIAHGC